MRETLQKLVEKVVTDLDYEFVGLELGRRPGNDLLRVYIDRAVAGDIDRADARDVERADDDSSRSGITLDDCQRVSSNLSAMLDVEKPLAGRYTLEVSSPGLDRPLFTEAHFVRFAGSKAKLVLSVPVEGRRKVIGRLMGVRRGQVVVALEDGEELEVPIDQVQKARLVPVISDA